MGYDQFSDDLLTKYSRIFTHTPSVDCDIGWYTLIDELSSELNEKAKQYNSETICVVQIKEKFGGLRYYVNYMDELPEEEIFDIEQIIRKYENLSYKTCSRCGKNGEICARKAYWISTLCHDCADGLKEG